MWRVKHKLFLSWWAICSSIKIMQCSLENTRFKITPVSVRCLNEFEKSYTITYTILFDKIGPAPIKHRYIVPPVWPSLVLWRLKFDQIVRCRPSSALFCLNFSAKMSRQILFPLIMKFWCFVVTWWGLLSGGFGLERSRLLRLAALPHMSLNISQKYKLRDGSRHMTPTWDYFILMSMFLAFSQMIHYKHSVL